MMCEGSEETIERGVFYVIETFLFMSLISSLSLSFSFYLLLFLLSSFHASLDTEG